MPHYKVCDCDTPLPSVNVNICKACNGFIDLKVLDNPEKNIEPKSDSPPSLKAERDKGTFKWFEDEPEAHPITEGDLRFADILARVVFHWSNKIMDDVDEEGNVSYKSGWVMKVPEQTIVYHNHSTYLVAHSKKEDNDLEGSGRKK